MQIALRFAKRGLGNVFPNPAVGCVIVQNNLIVGCGWTQKGGRPHAEIMALNFAKDFTQGATAYVTLEPCCHYGKTNPCVLELISSGIKKVVVATYDPDIRVSGNGLKILRENGIEVINGIMNKEAVNVNLGFFYAKKKNRPFITVKVASSLDGKIALSNGSSRWITNSLTRKWMHKKRSMYDAIMIGSNTLIKDNPTLTCRIDGLVELSPVRVILDRSGKINANSNIVKTADSITTYVLTNTKPQKVIKNINYIVVASNDNSFLLDSMAELVKSGITRLLVEGGSMLITEMFRHNLVDRLIWSRSHKILGNDAIASIQPLNLLNLESCYNLKKVRTLDFAEDIVEIFDHISL